MTGLTFNGRPFDPKDFEETLLRAIREKAASHLQEAIGGIRDPGTGEFPTVVTSVGETGTISARVEGSPGVLSVVQSRLASDEKDGPEAWDDRRQMGMSKVFLSYAWEDCELAERIARALMEAGIDTFWAEWSINAGDSIVQKINEGLGDATHFLVLLTPTSVKKPWVQTEMDAALVRRVSNQVKLIPLRHRLPVQDLPPLLRPLLSPEVNEIPDDIQQLVNDIHGISRKPELGRPPAAAVGPQHEDYSMAANMVAKVFVDQSDHAGFADPQLQPEKLIAVTGLTRDDVIDALHELGDVIDSSREFCFPKGELFVRFDGKFREWSPADDALRIAVDLVNDDAFPTDPALIAERYGWPPRRLNPALNYLNGRKLVHALVGIGHAPWAIAAMRKTDNTRRFVRSRGR